ncbi:pilus assembly FimT family protein [Garciella nitratireducens]|uniref:Prepilin-type N-terminal cleavage/methylation domain-containing protein n=1 Tax=Garciella nitratireducens DSM 15102 TaxID=1121911 RepID=A0A1T4K504_9FIRM|nr:prepilin-type N-terminal cleavage/methylation domain-containing protein [Garciella nitratireducens]RBP46677.1 prepilin-type N-terminal cleavage/methylation domain-containing protein [Garciella nitratireducens]SJZ37486.1 prepilin-type N-terminal cleavage/methylation domain-containing protein [Garciella nitratireducens DSM 15102]
MKKGEYGFTLIEIILVIAIIGVLLGIVGVSIPAYQDFIDRQKLEKETKNIYYSILQARNNAIMDGIKRKVFILPHDDIVKINKNIVNEKTILLSDGIEIYINTYVNSKLELKPIGTVSAGGHITLKSSRGHYATIVVQPTSGRIYMYEGKYQEGKNE